MKERSRNRQLAINLSANIIGFIVNLGIQFFLTPFIVKSLGSAAYGFVGLSNNIITFTQLIATALNSMAGRFITIKYTEGDIATANKYFSSVFYSNIILSIVIGVALLLSTIFIDSFLDVPANLVLDVKLLLGFLSINYIISLLTNIYSLATFIKNRLDLASIISIIANIFKAILLTALFTFCTPQIWYIGIIGTLYTIYIALTNIGFTKKLVPDLVLNKLNFDWDKVKELLSSGTWNTLSQLGTMLGQGLDLIIANLFIGATAMGVFSISRQIPFLIISFCAMISAVFTPSLTQLYAKSDVSTMLNEINKSVRLLSLFITIPLVFILVFGDSFYMLWVPSEDSSFLHLLTILCGMELVLSLPLESFWNVFMITNKIKVSTLFMLGNHMLTFIIVLIGMYISDSTMVQLIILASTRTILGIIRSLTFLPMYSAQCLELPLNTFYKPIIKTFSAFCLATGSCFVLRYFVTINSWMQLIAIAFVTMLICLISSMLVVLTKNDRIYLSKKINSIIF